MKQTVWCAGILLLINATAIAQTKTKKARTGNRVQSSNISKNKTVNQTNINTANTATLNVTGNYPAKATPSILYQPQTLYTISDPILTTLDQRAKGAYIPFNKSGIVGMPKRAYGFANGRVVLNSAGAVTSGTQTGSGAIGTGSSLATFGSFGAPMNVNGKSPYVGNNMWGNAMNMNIMRRDSSVRTPFK